MSPPWFLAREPADWAFAAFAAIVLAIWVSKIFLDE
jgi:hypothetical protein